MNVGAREAAEYLARYVASYRTEYQRFTSSPPTGGGYPPLRVSPYLYSSELTCYLATDGAALADFSYQPAYDWYVAGGPALLVDYEDTRVPPGIVELRQRLGLAGQPIGIYRLVARKELPADVWNGDLGKPVEIVDGQCGQTKIRVKSYKCDWTTLISTLIFGAFVSIVDIHLKSIDSQFWFPNIISDLGFATADLCNKRFFHYLELIRHVEAAAWEPRAIELRVQVDVRRDFGRAVVRASQKGGGSMSIGTQSMWVERFFDRLSVLGVAISKFEKLLESEPWADESVFHNFLEQNPISLDVYGQAISKPRFLYPTGESPLGKAYVEPDFVLVFPGNSYRLIELEKPSKPIATTQGQPRAEVTQATFQIGEWKAYNRNHYELLKEGFPGLSTGLSTMIVISRSSQESFKGRDIRKYMEILKQQFAVDEVLTYDDLLLRNRQAYVALASLAFEPPPRKGTDWQNQGTGSPV